MQSNDSRKSCVCDDEDRLTLGRMIPYFHGEAPVEDQNIDEELRVKMDLPYPDNY